jgi:hypothetical protein
MFFHELEPGAERYEKSNGSIIDQTVHASNLAKDDKWELKEINEWATIEAHRVKDSSVRTQPQGIKRGKYFGYSETTKLQRFFCSLLRID